MTVRLLVVSEPGNAGVKRHVVETLEALDLNRFDVHFIYSLERADDQYVHEVRQLSQRGIHTYEVPMVRSISPSRDLRCYFQVARHISRLKPQIVHAHSAKAGYLARRAAKPILGGVRPITVYTPNAMPCYRSKLYHRLERWAARWTDWLIAVTPSEKRDIVGWGILPEDRVRVVPMGIGTRAVDSPQNDDEFVVGGCGRICDQKNAVLFFQAGEQLLASTERAKLVWIGDYSGDEHSQQVKQLVENSKYRDRIRITGWLADPAPEMAKLNAFCMFSAYESFGFVTADAMAMGVPVVGTKTTGTIDLVRDGETGLLVGNNPTSAFEALKQLHAEPGLSKRLAKTAQEFVRREYAPEDCVARLQAFYEEVLGREAVR